MSAWEDSRKWIRLLTTMNNVSAVQVVDSLEDLLDGLRSILFSKLALIADSIEQLATSSKLSDNVKLVLCPVQLLRSSSIQSVHPLLTQTSLGI